MSSTLKTHCASYTFAIALEEPWINAYRRSSTRHRNANKASRFVHPVLSSSRRPVVATIVAAVVPSTDALLLILLLLILPL